MRLATAFLLVAVSLAGCTYDEDPNERFTPSCPSWISSPSVPRWSSPQAAMRHDADSPNPDVAEPTDWSKWIPMPGDVGPDGRLDSDPKIYANGTLGYVELTFTNVSLMDSLLVFEAYRASDSEPTVTPSGEDPVPPTGSRLQFTTALAAGGTVSSEVRFGPHVGDDDILWNQSAHVYLDLQPGPDQVNPSRVRLDARYTGNQDGNTATDSFALFHGISAKFWYIQNHCISR